MTEQTNQTTSGRLRVSTFFLAAGVGIGAWAASLPAVSGQMGLTSGELGIVLLCFALGAIIMMTSMGKLAPKVGASLVCVVGAFLFGAALVAAPHIADFFALCVLVGLGGGAFGALDVAMNVEAAAIERLLQRPVMSSFHAIFSFGALGGALICGWLLSGGGSAAICLGTTGVAVCVLTLGAGLWPGPRDDGRDSEAKPSTGDAGASTTPRRPRLLLLGAMAFLALFSEGALMDWIAIYLVDTVGTTKSSGAFGFAIFAGMMACGRAGGDFVIARIGAEKVLGFGAAAVALALFCALSVGSVALIFVAFAVAGLAIANVVPMIFSAAGRIEGTEASVAMSRVATMGYAGLLVGPPFIGFVAEATSLTTSLCFVGGAMIVVMLNGGIVRR